MPEINEEVKKQMDELVELNKQLLAQNEELKKTNVQLQKDVDDLLKAEDGLECELEDGSKGTMQGGKCVAKVDKAAVPEAVQKQMDAQAAQIKKQDAEIAKMREREETREYVVKAEGYQHLPIKAEELGPILKAAGGMPEAQRNELDRVLKAADAAFAELAKVKGSGASDDASNAYNKLMGMAKELKKVDPKISIEKAFSKVCEENPSLYQQHKTEQRAH